MPERKATYKVESASVQGEDSWVELSYMTWGEVQAAMKGDLKSDDILKEHVLAWNWVDGEGKPLDISVDVLFEPERRFLLDRLFDPGLDPTPGGVDDSKN